MNVSVMDGFIVMSIAIGCWCVGYVMHRWMPTDRKWIPTVMLVLGAISGIMLFGFDYEGIVKGMVSGLASTGFDQLFRQHLKLPMGDDELLAMGKGFAEEYDLDIHEDAVLDEEEYIEDEEESNGRQ